MTRPSPVIRPDEAAEIPAEVTPNPGPSDSGWSTHDLIGSLPLPGGGITHEPGTEGPAPRTLRIAGRWSA